ncbi:MAG: hypothetical protein IT176_12795 [Acidobacteria bacterium]|nr:hypothetical protein [Acidobacteriota bacterium]
MGEKPEEEYCRRIESYLCAKNDGHLIRVVGPSFEIVSGWAARGVPLQIAFEGIDRHFERYYARGPRRRPVKIDFCEADVLDVFDQWRRAIGLVQSPVDGRESAVDGRQSTESRQSPIPRQSSLPAHLERVLLKLSNARAKGILNESFDAALDGVARELDAARAGARGLRGEARQALVARLDALDVELGQRAASAIGEQERGALAREADDELAAFRLTMPPEAFARARAAALDRLIRRRLALPSVRLDAATG